ncbi:MAG: TraY domain-containing protein [Alphaproteobacteria bacterium]|nr:TraY domain-containing protein [Alphaproteobacteria bacterium]
MLALRLPPEIEARLEAMAKKTGRTKSFYAREAIVTYLEDLEDYYLAVERIESGDQELMTWDEVKAELSLTTKKPAPECVDRQG